MNQKKILFVGNTAWSMYNFRLGIMLNFKQLGFEIYIAAPNDEYAVKLNQHGLHFIPIKSMNNKGTNLIEDLKLYKELHSIYKVLVPDLIFHYTIKPNIYGVWAAKNLRIKTIAITTGLGFAFTHQSIISTIVKKLYKWSFRYAEEVWFLNRDDSAIFIDNHIIPASKAFILPSEGIDTTYFKPLVNEESLDVYSFLFSARLILDKGIEEFVHAIQLLHEKGYRIIGNIVGFLDVSNPKGISKELLDTWTANSYIKYLGSTSDIRPFIQKSSCVVLPSYYREGVPRILLESASMERPIITTDNVGCRDVVDHAINGYLCKIKDVKDLAEKMEQFINLTPEQRLLMGEKGRQKIVQQFDERIIFKYYMQCIQKYIT